VCDRAFSRSGILQNHMKVHTGEKAFECTVCNKRFSRSALLTWHSRIHTGVKPYQCSLCGKVFRLSGVLRTHMRRLHSTEMASLQLNATEDHDSTDGTSRFYRVHYMLLPVHLSVCRLQRSCALLSRLKFSAIFLCHLLPWPSIDIHGKFYGDCPRGNPPSGFKCKRGGQI